MRSTPRLVVTTALAAAVAASWAGSASAAPAPAAGFGQHVSACARAHLGPRPDPPALTCDGHLHANFGEAVQHIREAHG